MQREKFFFHFSVDWELTAISSKSNARYVNYLGGSNRIDRNFLGKQDQIVALRIICLDICAATLTRNIGPQSNTRIAFLEQKSRMMTGF